MALETPVALETPIGLVILKPPLLRMKEPGDAETGRNGDAFPRCGRVGLVNAIPVEERGFSPAF